MKKLLLAATFLILGAVCAHRYGMGVGYYTDSGWGPGWWGTVSYAGPSYVDFDYVGGGGRHFTRRAYWNRSSQWDHGMAYNTLRPGERGTYKVTTYAGAITSTIFETGIKRRVAAALRRRRSG